MENDFDIIDVEEVTSLNNLQIYQQDKAAINMQLEIARRYPRNLNRVVENCISLVTIDKEVAEKCNYALRKGKLITGPSVYLARIIAQEMGNLRVENRVVGYDSTHVTCEAIAFDLEKNYIVRTQIKKSIVGKEGRYSEDLCVLTGNAGNAVAFRNVIFSIVNQGLVNKIYKAALQAITGDLSDETALVRKRTNVINGLKTRYSSYKLTDEEIVKSVNRLIIDHITAEDIAVLVGFDTSLKNGDATIESIFRPSQKQFTPAPEKKDKSEERILLLIGACTTVEDLNKLKKDSVSIPAIEAWDNKFSQLKNTKDATK